MSEIRLTLFYCYNNKYNLPVYVYRGKNAGCHLIDKILLNEKHCKCIRKNTSTNRVL